MDSFGPTSSGQADRNQVRRLVWRRRILHSLMVDFSNLHTEVWMELTDTKLNDEPKRMLKGRWRGVGSSGRSTTSVEVDGGYVMFRSA